MTITRSLMLALGLVALGLSCQTTQPQRTPDFAEGLVIRPGVPPDSLEGLNRWVRHFWERLEVFREENAALSPDERCVVLLGDSLTEGWKLGDRVAQFLPEGRCYLNRGITSDHVLGEELGILRRLDESVFDSHPSHVFFLMGVNDLARCWRTGGEPSEERIFAGYRLATEAILERCPETTLCLVTASPVSGRYEGITPHILKYNVMVRKLAAERDLPLIDLFALLADEGDHLPEDLARDGLHFGDEGYRIYGLEIAQVLSESENR